ncbi:aminoacyl-tRNA hydrolase [Rathayibacter toxicus]|uniref:Peptidyl-tRNA hydrolase n=1 Tax=Rathayibacter toxicus TaxID=145458 RepID=A0A0C5BGG1_9MICO|nr:aminoacyl-tRNA hydrolase [Rathayibacter toxicus]AJM77310.1 peptidyl-tRNA hydrolase [Rathayibacter toxicus]ALS56823.1 peptidyl-tRNA hydrolase [Rathayibacter toxicus]KKM46333.1 peptidyl-tRNA hydrolase [Rathayibacter toxicus]PPG23315.1 aminoacyl-tRNA hydrolase [Rathayibacter toxicus]PPG47898.1 aminoacyl-tRNA hydrolase [Rathayibacter toxicus]
MGDTWLVVGLGNPGPQYLRNRHNIGQMVIDDIAIRITSSFRRHNRANAMVAEGFLRPAGPKLVLAKPNSFMNLSGGPTAQLLDFYSLEPSRLIVVHDELDIPFDTLRLKWGGGHGGHNGLRDILAATDGGEFFRVRVGIGRPPGRQQAADFVLRDFVGAERDALPVVIADAADAVELIVESGLAAAQHKVHTAS